MLVICDTLEASMRVLLAAHPTVGHTNALLAIGRRLRHDGAAVRFALPALPRTWLPAPEIGGEQEANARRGCASYPRRTRPPVAPPASAVYMPGAGYKQLYTIVEGSPEPRGVVWYALVDPKGNDEFFAGDGS